MAIAEVEHVSKYFNMPDRSSLHVIDDISFSVEKEEFTCLLGPSGCGKSTLLYLILGLLPSSSGRILVKGRVVTPNNKPDGVSIVFQHPRLIPWKKVKTNLKFALETTGKIRKIPEEKWGEIIEHYLHMMELEKFKEYYPRQLSGGMQSRVAIARAYCVNPELILMDEPFSHLDALTAARMRAELLKLWKAEKKAIIFVTHDISEAIFLADKIIVFTPRPASTEGVIKIDIARPRDPSSPAMLEYHKKVLDCLYSGYRKR